MKKITQEKLDELLVLHKKWLNSEPGGKKLLLIYTDLNGLDLSRKDLRFANLEGVNLSYANLKCANLESANLLGAILIEANLTNVYTNLYTQYYFMQCPEKGSYIAYKKCKYDRIVELLIPEDAKRSSDTTRKCRASKAKVLSITSIDRKESYDDAVSYYDASFVYKVGETVEVPDFCEDRWQECAAGIHHFITREEAVYY